MHKKLPSNTSVESSGNQVLAVESTSGSAANSHQEGEIEQLKKRLGLVEVTLETEVLEKDSKKLKRKEEDSKAKADQAKAERAELFS